MTEREQVKMNLLKRTLAKIRELSEPDYDAEPVGGGDYDDYLRMRSILGDIHKWTTQGMEP